MISPLRKARVWDFRTGRQTGRRSSAFNFDKQQIVQVDIASGQVVRTFSETSQGFGVSPDGRFLVAGSKSGEPNALHLIPMSGGEKRELIRFSPPATSVLNWGTIAWSPDSQGVAFFGTVRGDKGMWLAPIDGSQPRKIASGIESMGVWRFNATSGQVVFSSDAAPRVEVWKIENFLPVQTAKR